MYPGGLKLPHLKNFNMRANKKTCPDMNLFDLSDRLLPILPDCLTRWRLPTLLIESACRQIFHLIHKIKKNKLSMFCKSKIDLKRVAVLFFTKFWAGPGWMWLLVYWKWTFWVCLLRAKIVIVVITMPREVTQVRPIRSNIKDTYENSLKALHLSDMKCARIQSRTGRSLLHI